MSDSWQRAFIDHGPMWGLEPARSAVLAAERFAARGARHVLVPGIGYGRNALPFLERGMDVTGIEVSDAAIELARSQLALTIPIHHGSVTDMPFDTRRYDGIYCHGLLYLLDAPGRARLVRDCFAQLAPGGQMMFTVISRDAPMYGRGTRLGEHWFETHPGMRLYFYDEDGLRRALEPLGPVELTAIDEPSRAGPALPFLVALVTRPATQPNR